MNDIHSIAGPRPTTRAGIPREDISGLILAGGRATRMGGVDKGLQAYRGAALIDHAIARLRPQVGEILVSANRNADAYALRGLRVLRDETDDYPGPLAGILAGLRAARTPWVAVAPCDSPRLPAEWVARLADAVAADPSREGAVAQLDRGVDGLRIEPVCCLVPTSAADGLELLLAGGCRKVGRWIGALAAPVLFDRPGDLDAFANFNTLSDLED